jgi:hypothetical protein
MCRLDPRAAEPPTGGDIDRCTAHVDAIRVDVPGAG